MLHNLSIPDALLAWGKEQAAAEGWRRSWAHEAERLAAAGKEAPLSDKQATALLSRLEALLHAASEADRADLLDDLDLFTAEWLGLRFELTLPDGREVSIGRGAQWNYQEVRALLDSGKPKEALALVEQTKTLVTETFPAARVASVVDTDDEQRVCEGCGQRLATVMLTLDSGSGYCSKCWVSMISESTTRTK